MQSLFQKAQGKSIPRFFFTEMLTGKIKISNKEQADKILAELEDAEYQVVKVKKRYQEGKSPAPPFITSTLQQEASRKLGFQARRTMESGTGTVRRC